MQSNFASFAFRCPLLCGVTLRLNFRLTWKMHFGQTFFYDVTEAAISMPPPATTLFFPDPILLSRVLSDLLRVLLLIHFRWLLLLGAFLRPCSRSLIIIVALKGFLILSLIRCCRQKNVPVAQIRPDIASSPFKDPERRRRRRRD